MWLLWPSTTYITTSCPLACCGGGPTLHKEGPLTSFIGFVGRAVPSRISRFPRPGAVILNYLQDLGISLIPHRYGPH